MPKGVYERTEENRKKIGEARRRYYDEHGRVVEIDQRVNPRDYQREYQRQWRAKHKHYYRDRLRLKTANEGKLENIVAKFNELQANLIECKYNTREFNQEALKSLVTELKRMIMKYIRLLETECEVSDVSKS